MKHFEMGEFACKHCQQLPRGGMDTRLLDVLDKMRERLGEPLVVSSGYRCPTHNRNSGGASQSYHMKGMAADVYTNSGHRQCNGNKITTFVAPLSDKALITLQSM